MGEKRYMEQAPVITGDDAPITDDVRLDTQIDSGIGKQNPALLFLAVLLLFGMLLGALFIAKADKTVLETLDYLFFSNLQTRMNNALFPVFIASMTSSFLFILLSYFCGLSMWGSILIPAIPLLRGFGLGMTAGYVYGFGGAGVFYYILLILPGAFVSIIAILFSAMQGMWFSKQLNFYHKTKRKTNAFAPQPSVRNYTVRFALITVLAVAAALVDMLTAVLFSGLFRDFIV